MSERIPDTLPPIAPPAGPECKPVDVLAVLDSAHFNLDFAAQAERLPHPENLRMAANARDAIAETRHAVAELFEASKRAERKLSAYVGVCTGDKELTDTILPMLRTALARVGGAV